MFIIALLVACGMAHAKPYDRIRVRPFDRTFRVDFYPDDERRPYRVVFFDDGVRSKYRFNDEGLVRAVRVERDQYSVLYTSRNELKRVEERSRRRVLAVEEENEVKHRSVWHPNQRRRLHTCAECTATWTLMCGPGVLDIFTIQWSADVLRVPAYALLLSRYLSMGKLLSPKHYLPSVYNRPQRQPRGAASLCVHCSSEVYCSGEFHVRGCTTAT